MGFDINVLATKAVAAVSKRNGKKVNKKYIAPPIPDVDPVRLKGDKFTGGYACEIVMPKDVTSKFYGIAGHGSGRKIEGVHDPVTVSALWLGCGDGGIITVAADIIGLTNVEVRKIRDSLASFSNKVGCKSINICCSHSHAGFDTVGYWGKLPKTGKDAEYMNQLFEAIRSVCIRAYEKRTEGKLFVGYAHVPECQFIRQEPHVYHDALTRIRFVPDNGAKETWLLNYGAHPNTLGGPNRLVSADYPFYLRETVKAEKDVNVMFGVGAIGAVDPGNFCEDRPERTKIQGETLGNAALAINDEEELCADITVLSQPFYYPVDNTVLNFLAMLHVMSSDKYPCEKGELKMALKSEMTYLKIGHLQILLLPGEEFPPLAYGGYRDCNHSATGKGAEINPEPLVETAKDDKLLIFGVTNDMCGYVVPPNEFILNPDKAYLDTATDKFGNRHYHETNSLGYLSAETISNVFKDIIKRVNI